MAFLSFIFQSGLEDIDDKVYLTNCPYPTFGIAPYDVNIENNRVTYSLNYSDANAGDVYVFNCYIDTGNQALQVIHYDSSDGFFSLFDNAFAWIGYAYNSITAFFQKAQANIDLVYTYIDAPAQVTQFAFFSYVNGILVAMVILGIFLMVRGGG